MTGLFQKCRVSCGVGLASLRRGLCAIDHRAIRAGGLGISTGAPRLLAQFEPGIGGVCRFRKPFDERVERRRGVVAQARQRLGSPHLKHGTVGRGTVRLGVEQFLEC